MEETSKKKMKSLKSKAVRGFALFLLFMLCCTVISRGIYAYQMPQVETGRAERKRISHVVEAMGSVAAVKESAVVAPEGIRVAEICVREGESVEPDTVLFRLDMDSLAESMEDLDNRIVLLEQRLKEMKSDQRIAEQLRQTEAARAGEDLENVTRTQEMAVERARQQYDNALSHLNGYPVWETYFNNRLRQDGQYQMMLEDPEQGEALQTYVSALQSSLQTEWAEGRRALEEAVKEAESALQAADHEKNLALLQAKRYVEDTARETTKEKSSIMETEQRLQDLQEQMETYQLLSEQEGRILAGMEGGVRAIRLSAGDRTQDTAAMILAEGSEGWLFEACLTKEQMNYLNPKDSVTLRFRNDTMRLEECPVMAVSAIDSENYSVAVQAGDKSLIMGEVGTLEITKQDGPYNCCVPLSAIYTMDNKNYIYVIRETDTILGTELRVVKRQVKVIDRNDSYAALEEGTLGEEEKFVVASNKEIKAGDTVRPMEADLAR